MNEISARIRVTPELPHPFRPTKKTAIHDPGSKISSGEKKDFPRHICKRPGFLSPSVPGFQLPEPLGINFSKPSAVFYGSSLRGLKPAPFSRANP